ncbi:alpha-mannosidase [candidate division KSB1 bacterium]|nr:alpha-mannosidase [candidate division KSB1 bacterium]MBL7093649.1 alpha-mannosidase [candidate division KSB1 bacterium]
MIKTERNLYESRIEVFIKRLKDLYYEDEIPLTIEYKKFENMESFDKRLDGKYDSIKKGVSWGSNWERAWFHITGEVPNEWKGKLVVARIDLGGEALIFDKDGTPLQSLSVHNIWGDGFRRDRFEISEKAEGGEKVDLWIEASAGQLFGVQLEQDKGNQPPKKFGNYEATIGTVALTVFRKDIWHLYLDFLVLNDLMKSLPEKSVRRARILHVLNNVIDSFKEDAESVKKARDMVAVELKKSSSASDLKTMAVGHAHLDTAWLWPLSETIRKCARTFSTQIDLIEKYPGYIFGASQPQHYAFVKKYYPALYEKIKEKVAEGKWELQGGMWIEADCNVISGESMVRQVLHGKNFFKDEFNQEIKNLWLPDVFGYSAAMPQILKKSGIDYFITQKISWSQFNKFPYHTFVWRGIDGTEVITHFPPEDDYNSQLKPSRLKYAEENFQEKAYLDEFLTLFGIGDGGGGPTEEIIETGLRQANLEGCPQVEFGTAHQMLDRLAQKKENLPTWVGELYLEMHRGTLTTQAYNKKMNRFMELKLRELEVLYSTLPFENYPTEKFDKMWKKLLLNQFHDIIPGSSITPVYEDSRKDYEFLSDQAHQLSQEVGKLLFEKNEANLCLINTLSFSYSRAIELPDSWNGFEVLDETGNKIQVQSEGNKSVALINIPPLRAINIKRGTKAGSEQNNLPDKNFVLENDLVRYEFDNSGFICTAYDKEAKKQILAEGQKGNVLSLYEDRPVNWDAWDVDIFYEKQLLENAQLESRDWLCTGKVRQGIKQSFKIGNSKITQKIYLTSNSKRLDFKTDVDWQEDHKMLRVSFGVNVYSDTATFEIQYGHVRRNTHRNTSWDIAKFEVAGHRFADLSDRQYGVALLNDCKYGYKILDNVIDLNLLRSPTNPDPIADRGKHKFTFALLPHINEMIESDVLSEAAQLNQPPAVFGGVGKNELVFPYFLDSEDVVLEVIKKAEKEDGLIIRLYEPKEKQTTVELKLNISDVIIFETDLMENNLKELQVKNNCVNLEFTPFEIKTIKVKWS